MGYATPIRDLNPEQSALNRKLTTKEAEILHALTYDEGGNPITP